MGTHPSAPSVLADNGYTGQPLAALLRDRPEYLGAALPLFGADLPFLFKVLSVGTALSIQSHPDKALAERLHSQQPEVGVL
jgi:mannose-6-phosphate isomerase